MVSPLPRRPRTQSSLSPRVLTYAINGVGLGHLRTTLAIAGELDRRRPDAAMLALVAAFEAHAFELPRNFDYVKLPDSARLSPGQTRAPGGDPAATGQDSGSSHDRATVRHLRQRLIIDTVEVYRPNVFLVDFAPAGVYGELRRAIALLREGRPRGALVLGLHDISGDGERIRKQWAAAGVYDLLESAYDRVLIYGMRDIFDPVIEYAFPPAVAAKTVFCGYLRRHETLIPPERIRAELGVGTGPLVVVAGGASSGVGLLRPYFAAARGGALDGLVSFAVAGPQLRADEMTELAAAADGLRQVTFAPFSANLLSYLNAADVVVVRGGYNTISEVASLGKRAVVVPHLRVISPERGIVNEEQLMRAERFAARGLVTMIHPDELTPGRLASAVRESLTKTPPVFTLDFDGLSRVVETLEAFLPPGYSRVG